MEIQTNVFRVTGPAPVGSSVVDDGPIMFVKAECKVDGKPYTAMTKWLDDGSFNEPVACEITGNELIRLLREGGVIQ